MIPLIDLARYTYDLPEDRIALHPLPERDACRLLVCSTQPTSLEHRRFSNLTEYLFAGDTLILNSTRVVRARIPLQRRTGGRSEVFLLEPLSPSTDPSVTLAAHGSAEWSCLVRGGRKLASEPPLQKELSINGEQGRLGITLCEELSEGYRVRFEWTPTEWSFADILEALGDVPLPPYIRRRANAADTEEYQTVYADLAGAVAAPTAGLHFTPTLLKQLASQGVASLSINLHVGAGTFRPIKGTVSEHAMHRELISVSAESLAQLHGAAVRRARGSGRIVQVGTTSLRATESLYWLGVRLLRGEPIVDRLLVEQWDPYRLSESELPDLPTALNEVISWSNREGSDGVTGHTGIIIVPGYRFAACDALITNFHQPGSTLLLLVGALMGEREWREAYEVALSEGYRFLSYGDAMLLRGASGVCP